MSLDPLSGHKATYDFLEEMLTDGESSPEVEKASGYSPQAQKLYDLCVAGGKTQGDDPEVAQRECSALAAEFDKEHPNGLPIGDAPEAPDVEKSISTAGMAADLGEPSASVELTDVPEKKRKRLPVGQ